ncbi:MAG: hypothetical protein ACXVCM_08345, partial [Ktedonobacteraceae bacterium]
DDKWWPIRLTSPDEIIVQCVGIDEFIAPTYQYNKYTVKCGQIRPDCEKKILLATRILHNYTFPGEILESMNEVRQPEGILSPC